MKTVILKERGEKMKVKISKDEDATELTWMTNGFQWHGFNVSDEMLELLATAIKEYQFAKDLEVTLAEDAKDAEDEEYELELQYLEGVRLASALKTSFALERWEPGIFNRGSVSFSFITTVLPEKISLKKVKVTCTHSESKEVMWTRTADEIPEDIIDLILPADLKLRIKTKRRPR